MSENQKEQGERLRQARLATGNYPKAADAARAMGLEVVTYQGHENGSRGFKANASRYADFFRVNLNWLWSGKGPMKRAEQPNAPSAPLPPDGGQEFKPQELSDLNIRAMPMNLPVYGSASCGDDGMFEFNGQVLDHVRRPPRLMNVPKAYAVYIEGDSMSPWREHGELAYVHPGMPIKIGDYVVVQVKPKEAHSLTPPAYIKKLVRRTPTQLVLHQFNPAGDITIPLKDVKEMHRVIPWSELMTI